MSDRASLIAVVRECVRVCVSALGLCANVFLSVSCKSICGKSVGVQLGMKIPGALIIKINNTHISLQAPRAQCVFSCFLFRDTTKSRPSYLDTQEPDQLAPENPASFHA